MLLGGNTLGSAVGVITLDTSGVDQGVSNTMGQLQQLDAAGSAGFSNLEKSITGVGLSTTKVGAGLTGLGAALLAPIAVGVKGAMSLEQAFTDVKASMDSVDHHKMPELEKMIIDIGASGQYSAGEIAAVTEELVKSGFAIDTILSGDPSKGFGNMAQAVSDLASATGAGLGPAVTAMSAAMNIWHPSIVSSDIALTDAARAADIFTVAANASSADVSDISDGMRNFGPVAASLGIGFEDAAASIAYFTNYGLKARVAGTALSTAMQRLAAPTGKAADTMKELGISAWDSQGKFIGMPALFNQLRDRMSGMTDEAKMAALTTIFGAEAMDVMGIAVIDGADGLTKITEAMNDYGIAGRQAAMRTQTLQGAWERLTEGFYTMLAVIAGGLIGPLTLLANGLDLVTSAVMKLPEWVLQAIGVLVTIAGVAASATGAFLLFAPRVRELMTAMRALSGMSGALGGLARIFLTLTGMARPFTALASAILSVAGASKLLTLAFGGIIGLGIFAFNTNALGFGDWVRDQVATAMSAWEEFKSLFGISVNKEVDQAFGTGTGLEGSIVGEAGSGADGKDWFVLNEDGERIGQILESYKDADGTIQMKVEMPDGTQQWLTQGPDGTTSWGESTAEQADIAVSGLQRFNTGMDKLKDSLRNNGYGFLVPPVSMIQTGVNKVAGVWNGLKDGIGWVKNFNRDFLEAGMDFMGLGGPSTQAFNNLSFGEKLKTAWEKNRPDTGFFRDLGDAIMADANAGFQARVGGGADVLFTALGFPDLREQIGQYAGPMGTAIASFARGVQSRIGAGLGGTRKFLNKLTENWGLNEIEGIGAGGRGKRGVGPLQTGMGDIREVGLWDRAYRTLADTMRGMGWDAQAEAVEKFGAKVSTGLNMIGNAGRSVQKKFNEFTGGFTTAWSDFSRSAPDMGGWEKGIRSLAAGLDNMGLETAASWMRSHAKSIGLVAAAIGAGLLTLTSGSAMAAVATTALLTGISFLPGILNKVADGLDFLGLNSWADKVREWATSVEGFHDTLVKAAYAGVILRNAMLRLGIVGAAGLVSLGKAAYGSIPGIIAFGRTWLQFFASGKVLDWLGKTLTWENIDGFFENIFGKAFSFSLNLSLDLIIKFFEDPGTQVRNMIIAAIAGSFTILTVTGGISAALVLLGIVGLAALVAYVVKKVADYFLGSPEARAEVSIRIGIIWGHLEKIPILGPVFTFARLIYTYMLKPLIMAGVRIRNWMHDQGGIFERIAEMFERSWLAMAGLNLLEKLGASAIMGKYMKQVGDARVAVSGLEAAMYGFFKLLRLPFEFTFRPLDLLKQITGGTDGRALANWSARTMDELSKMQIGDILDPKTPKEIRMLMGLSSKTNEEFRMLNRLGAAFADSLRLARSIIASFFHPITAIRDGIKRWQGGLASYRAYLGEITGLSGKLAKMTLFGENMSAKQIGEVLNMYRHFVDTYGDFDINRIFNADLTMKDEQLKALRVLSTEARKEYGKIFNFIAKYQGDVGLIGPKWSPKRWVAWIVAMERTLSNALRRRGGIAGMLHFALIKLPIELPATILSKVFNLDNWLKSGMKSGAFARPIREWWARALDPSLINYSRRSKLISNELRAMLGTIRANYAGPIKNLGDDFYTKFNKAFDPDNLKWMAKANVDELRSTILDEMLDIVRDVDGRVARIQGALKGTYTGKIGGPNGFLDDLLKTDPAALERRLNAFNKAEDDIIRMIDDAFKNVDEMSKVNRTVGQRVVLAIDSMFVRINNAVRTGARFVGRAFRRAYITMTRGVIGGAARWVDDLLGISRRTQKVIDWWTDALNIGGTDVARRSAFLSRKIDTMLVDLGTALNRATPGGGSIVDDVIRSAFGDVKVVSQTADMFRGNILKAITRVASFSPEAAQELGKVFDNIFSQANGPMNVKTRQKLMAQGVEDTINNLKVRPRPTGFIMNAIEAEIRALDLNRPVSAIMDDLSKIASRIDTVIPGGGKASQAVIDNILGTVDDWDDAFTLRGSRLQRLVGALFDVRLNFAGPAVMKAGGSLGDMFTSIGRLALGTVENIARFGRGLTDVATGPLRLFGRQFTNIGKNFNSMANIFAKVFPWFDRFGSMGPRVALGLTIAGVASAIWAKNLFGLKDAFGGVVTAIGDGLGAIGRGWREGGLGGVIEEIEQGIFRLKDDIPGALNAIAESPAWNKIFAAFAIFGGMFVGGLPGLVIGLGAPWIADAANEIVGSIGRISAAYADVPEYSPEGYRYTDEQREMIRAENIRKAWITEFSGFAGGIQNITRSIGSSLIGIGDAVENWPAIGPILSKGFNKAGKAVIGFSRRMGVMKESFEESILAGDSVGQALFNAFDRAFPSLRNFAEQWNTTFGPKASAAWNKFTQMAIPFRQALGGIANAVMALGDPLGQIIGSFGQLFSGNFTGFISQLADGFRDLLVGVLDVGVAFGALRAVSIATIFGNLADQFPGLAEGFNMIGRGLQFVNNGVTEVMRGLQDILNGNFTEGFQHILGGFEAMGRGIWLAIQGVWSLIQEVDWSGLWDGIWTSITGIDWAGIGAAVITAFQSAWPSITATVNFIMNILGAIGEAFWNAYSTAAEWIVNNLPSAGAWIADFLSGDGAEITAGDVTIRVGVKGSLWTAITEGTVEEWVRNNAALLAGGAVIVALLAGVPIPIVAAGIILSSTVGVSIVSGIKEQGLAEWLRNNWQALGLSAIIGTLLLFGPLPAIAVAAIVLSAPLVLKIVDQIGDQGFWTFVKENWKAIGIGLTLGALIVGGPVAALGVAAAVITMSAILKISDEIGDKGFWTFVKDNWRAIGIGLTLGALIVGGPVAALGVAAAVITMSAVLKIADAIGDKGFWTFVKENWRAIGVGLTLGALLIGGPPAALGVAAAVIALPIVIDLIGEAVEWAGTAWGWIKEHSPGWVQDIMNGIEDFVAPSATVETPLIVKPLEPLMPIKEDTPNVGDEDGKLRGFGDITMPIKGGSIRMPSFDTKGMSLSAMAAQAIMDSLKANMMTRALETRTGVDSHYSALAALVPAKTGVMSSAVQAYYAQLAASLPAQTGAMGAQLGAAYNNIAAQALSQSSNVNTSWMTNTTAMRAGATNNTNALQAAASASFASLAANARSHSGNMSANTIANISNLRSVGVGQAGLFNTQASAAFASLAGSARSQTGTMASTAGANARSMAGTGISEAGRMNSGMTTSIAGIAGNIAGQAARWSWIVTSAGLHGAGSSAGYQLGAGMAAGMDASSGLVWAAAQRLIAIARTAAAAAAVIRSPSRLFADTIGLPIAQGVAMGMVSTGAIHAIGESARGMIDAAESRVAGSTIGVRGQTAQPSRQVATTQIIYRTNLASLNRAELLQVLDNMEKGREAYEFLDNPDAFSVE